ncbi:MAG: phospho-N-acetylmuramoyl-pentapeptide-transferase, partial [Varibaculum cambriense]|nr:phospho-N-acetylmuramoyl-pentapeptide-transferase [Varibaculum cambriense]
AIISLAIVGACFGFLWWNTSPAQIFMGDTGSLALGGAFAGLSILTRTEFLAVIIGGLFVLIVMSDVIQVGVFKLTRKRVFKMAPLHHHFELKGWKEVTIVVRFWIIAGLFAIVGVALFYAEWVVAIK